MEKISPSIQNFCAIFERNKMRAGGRESEKEREEMGFGDSENYEVLLQSLLSFGISLHQSQIV